MLVRFLKFIVSKLEGKTVMPIDPTTGLEVPDLNTGITTSTDQSVTATTAASAISTGQTAVLTSAQVTTLTTDQAPAVTAASNQPIRAISDVQSDLTAARVAHEAAQTALDAAKLAEKDARSAVGKLLAEGKALLETVRADFEAGENYLSGLAAKAEAEVGKVL